MRKGGGKQKGSAQERKLCELLSLWVSHGTKKDLYWRSAMSGGRATVIRKRGGQNRQCGDIVAVAPEGHALTDWLYLECKHVRDIRLETFILKGRGPIQGWWREACKQAKQHGREPVLIAKGNNAPIIVISKPGSMFNQHPVAHLSNCDIGLLDRILKTRFEGLEPRKHKSIYSSDKDLELDLDER
jgi:hypothetical protein